MKLLQNNPLAVGLAAVVLVVLAVFGWLYATDPDRQPAAAQSAASAPAAEAPSAVAPTSAPSTSSPAESDAEVAEPEATATPSASAQPNSALSQHAPEAGDWREPGEKFAAAYYDTHGGDKEAWLAGMKPYLTEEMYENFTYTHIGNVVDDEVESVESVQLESTTMTFKIHTAANGDQTIVLMELQPSGDWLVSAVGLTDTDLE